MSVNTTARKGRMNASSFGEFMPSTISGNLVSPQELRKMADSFVLEKA